MRIGPPGRRGGGAAFAAGAGRRHVDVGLELGVQADAEQALLQLAVGGEARGIDDAVDAAVDHDRDVARDRRGDTDVLLDHEHGHVAVLAEPHQHLLDLGDDDGRRPSVGSSMISSCGLVSSAREIASICCSPPESWPPPWSLRSASRGKVS